MKKTIIASAALLALPALAQGQRASLVFTQTKHEETTLSAGGPPTTLAMDNTTGLGLRYGITAAQFWQGSLEVEGTLRPRSNEKYLKVNGMELSPANTGGQSIKLSDEYLALGVGMRWTKVVDFGFMLEARQEAMTFTIADGTGFEHSQRNSVLRPWLRGHVGYTFQISAPVKPFVNLGYGFSLAKKGVTDAEIQGLGASGYSSDFIIDVYSRSVLPKSELSFEAGIRF